MSHMNNDHLNDDEEMAMGSDEDDEDLDEEDIEDDMHEEEEDALPEPQEEDAMVQRRRAIQAVMRDRSLSEQERNRRIQAIMSGNRTVPEVPVAPVLPQPEANTACVHYERNCNVVAPCCNRVFGCRICHDEWSPEDHPPMNRFLVQEVVCKSCNTRQPAS